MAKAKKSYSLTLSRTAYGEMRKLATLKRLSIGEVLQAALALYRTAVHAQSKKQRLFLVSEDGASEQEILLP